MFAKPFSLVSSCTRVWEDWECILIGATPTNKAAAQYWAAKLIATPKLLNSIGKVSETMTYCWASMQLAKNTTYKKMKKTPKPKPTRLVEPVWTKYLVRAASAARQAAVEAMPSIKTFLRPNLSMSRIAPFILPSIPKTFHIASRRIGILPLRPSWL